MARRLLRKRVLVVGAISILGLAVGLGSAFASQAAQVADKSVSEPAAVSTPKAASSIIYGCAAKSSGAMRLVSATTKCPTSENHVFWAQTGPPGAAGKAGPVGATGKAGTPGATGAAGSKGDTGAQGATGPAGSAALSPRVTDAKGTDVGAYLGRSSTSGSSEVLVYGALFSIDNSTAAVTGDLVVSKIYYPNDFCQGYYTYVNDDETPGATSLLGNSAITYASETGLWSRSWAFPGSTSRIQLPSYTVYPRHGQCLPSESGTGFVTATQLVPTDGGQLMFTGPLTVQYSRTY